MEHLATHSLRGPVHTMRSEMAEWDAASAQWGAPRYTTVVTFRRDGKIASHERVYPPPRSSRETYVYVYGDRGQLEERQSGASGIATGKAVYSYAPDGRLARVVNVAPDGTSTEAEVFRYDSNGRKTKVTFTDERMVLARAHESLPPDAGSRPATISATYDDRDLPLEEVTHNSKHEIVSRTTYEHDRGRAPAARGTACDRHVLVRCQQGPFGTPHAR